jgi:hypothetical protein
MTRFRHGLRSKADVTRLRDVSGVLDDLSGLLHDADDGNGD